MCRNLYENLEKLGSAMKNNENFAFENVFVIARKKFMEMFDSQCL
jgi:hypothetical protein